MDLTFKSSSHETTDATTPSITTPTTSKTGMKNNKLLKHFKLTMDLVERPVSR